MECELVFELGGQRLTVVRRMNDAALLVEGRQQDTGTENVTRAAPAGDWTYLYFIGAGAMAGAAVSRPGPVSGACGMIG